MNDVEIHEALVRWLSAQTGLRVIKAHQSGDRPDKPYLMINMLNCREVREHCQDFEFVETETLNSEGLAEISVSPVIEMEWDFSIHAYGDNPTNSLRILKGRTHLAQRLEPLFPSLIVHETGTINNVPDWVKNDWEPRAQMNLLIRGLTRDGAVVDVIQDASVGVSKGA
jgi:hypothetical protein